MPIIVTFTKPDGTVNQTETFDFGDTVQRRNNNIERMTAWARATYLNPDGTQPGQNAARTRVARSFVQGIRDALRKFELDAAKQAIDAPEDIIV